MANHDIGQVRRTRGGAATLGRRVFAVAVVTTAAIASTTGTALAADGSGGSYPPQPSGGSPAGSTHHKKHKAHKASHHVKLPKELKKIAMCESGGNPRAVSPSGRYRGKYQFDMETWHSLGGHGDPAKAPEWYQDKLALRRDRSVQEVLRQEAYAWPACR